MVYAKKCKYCNTIQVVWDDKLQGPNKFKEVDTNLPHSRDRCDAAKTGGRQGYQLKGDDVTPQQVQGYQGYSPQEQKEFVEQYRPSQPMSDEIIKIGPSHVDILEKLDKLTDWIRQIDKVVHTINDGMNAYLNEPTVVENRILKAKVNELEDIERQRTKEKDFVPANQVQVKQEETTLMKPANQEPMNSEHVQMMVRKGEQADEDEELDLT